MESAARNAPTGPPTALARTESAGRPAVGGVSAKRSQGKEWLCGADTTPSESSTSQSLELPEMTVLALSGVMMLQFLVQSATIHPGRARGPTERQIA